MKQTDRIVLFTIGFAVGTILVSSYLQFKENKRVTGQASESISNSLEANPLPDSVPSVFSEGALFDYAEINEDGRSERIWLLQFNKSYPFVRIVEDLNTGDCLIMAADQILLYLEAGVDVTEVKSLLDANALKVRMFNRNKNIVVIGVLNNGVDAVPMTLELVSVWTDLVAQATPDYIELRSF